MARFTCPSCAAGTDFPEPPPPGLVVTCPACRLQMVDASRPAPRTAEPGAPRARWSLRTQVRVLGGLVALCWVLVLVDFFLPWRVSLLNHGIRPRDVDSLVNILFAPFLHVGFGHVAANTMGFLVFGWLVLVRSPRYFLFVSLGAAVVSGLGCWLFGQSNSVHVGASGVIFGYFGFLITRGVFEGSVAAFVLSAAVAVAFGWMLRSVVTVEAGVSWEGHLFGLLGGALAAAFLPVAPRPVSREAASGSRDT